MTKPTFYLTTAIVYPNGAPHIGYAYEVIAADSMARFKRLDGYDVFFQIGADEHGQKVQQSARKEGLDPKVYVDRMVLPFQDFKARLDASFDRFMRTTDPDHYASAQELWRRMEANGDIYLDRYSGWYSVRDESYYDEADTKVGDDGVRVGLQNTPVQWVEEESYFFRLSAYQDRLLAYYAEHPEFIGPEARRNEVLSFVSRGLTDLSISRTTFDWGVPVPGAPKHVMYVWVDALQNYVTGCGFPNTKDPRWRYWPADMHIIGKDIVRFHAVYWPAFLMSAGLAVPKRVFCHGWLLNRGEKISKSVGNVIDPFALAEGYGVDQLRYFLLREVPFGQDGSYSHDAIVGRINADLANDFGNLAQRSLSMIARNCDGRVPMPATFSETDIALLEAADALPGQVRVAMDAVAPHLALAEIWSVIAMANRYFAKEEPWVKRKSAPERFATVLYATAEALRSIAIVTQPFIPSAAAKLLDLLRVPADKRMLKDVGPDSRIEAGRALPAPVPIFPRHVEPEAGTAAAR